MDVSRESLGGLLLLIIVGGSIVVSVLWSILTRQNIFRGASNGCAFGGFAFMVFLFFGQQQENEKYKNSVKKENEISSWITPIETLKAGEIRVKLQPISARLSGLSSSADDEIKSRVFDSLFDVLRKTQSPFTKDDIAAINEFCTQNNRTVSKVSLIWAEHLLDIDAALQTCDTNKVCQLGYLIILRRFCFENSTRCEQSLKFEKTHQWLNTFKNIPSKTDNSEQLFVIAAIELFTFSEKYSTQDFIQDISILNATLRKTEHIVSYDSLFFFQRTVDKNIEIQKQKFRPATANDTFYPSPELVELQALIKQLMKN
jgi:hypothetical protein